jgi:hypothetical protein
MSPGIGRAQQSVGAAPLIQITADRDERLPADRARDREAMQIAPYWLVVSGAACGVVVRPG